MHRSFSSLTLAWLVLAAAPATADTVKVLTSGAFKPVVAAMVPAFEARTGHKVEVANDTAGALAKRVAGGEAFDVLVLTPAALQPLAKDGKVLPDSIAPLAKVGIGVAVKAGAPKPAIGTVEEFRHALIDVRRIAYIDPASGGSSGIYLDGLFEKLGVAPLVRPKAVLVSGGLAADKLVSGEADLAMQQVSEILPVAGVDLVGLLPPEIQNYTTYAGALGAGSTHRAAAADFLKGLASEDARQALRSKGMLPP
ncbi:substrate-binding domain-containing protein [Rhizobacter sp. SG703]|uniref:substrate-binding domain-containing protein n=1 Tax=Rhizobacter sp. SG703 TaxID=2587140 RepID=UPI001448329D|nr:substrate-binding domain-containing protein [Rhizobacter sp. SG703]NKI96564.1 molybdate transport system substrate-binding protein [Rhizobacter sp. SG703]